jgi:hypothetical protein
VFEVDPDTEARSVLEPYRLVRHQLQAGQKAIAVAVLAATGSKMEAIALAKSMRPDHLTDAEYRLVYAFTTADQSAEFFVDETDKAAKAK